MYRLLIADASVMCKAYVVEKLKGRFEVAFCFDGREFHRIISEFEPDLILLDLHLQNANGLNLLRDIRAVGNTTPVIATTAFIADYLLTNLRNLNVVTVVRKPWSLDKILDEICELPNTSFFSETYDLDDELDYMLLRLGFKADNAAYKFTKYAILERFKCENSCLTKVIYPQIAKQNNGSSDYAEKAIRNGICHAKAAGDPDLWRAFFPALELEKSPTNDEFIRRIAMALRHREKVKRARPDFGMDVVNR